jgi:outer membrane protein assembly factor BamB
MEKYHQPKYDSPSLIVLDKHTGKLLAREREDIFMRTFHGAHSSPALGKVNGQELVFYGGGGGTCYAFDPNFAPSRNGEPAVLKLVWKFDCVAAPYDSGKPRLDRAEVIATPVFYRNRIYVSIGNDLEHSGDAAGPGRLLCVDATQTGDITATGKIWSFDTIGNTASTVAVADGLLYTADAAGNIYCLDAETGELYWQHKARSIWSSPLVADGKVFVADNTRGLLVLAAGKEKNLLSQLRVNADIVASPAVADGVLYIASARYLYALQKGASAELAVPAQPDDKLTSDKVKETQLYPEQRRTKLRRRVAFGATVALGVVVALAIVGGGFRRFKRSRRRR